jgi:DNA-binding response OmpR family regulator
MMQSSPATEIEHPRSILIIEDDAPIRETLKELLEQEGYRVFTASNGKEGLKVWENTSPPCAMLVDLMMPILDGWQVLSAVRSHSNPEAASVPVLVLSAARDVKKQVLELGANGFVRKPIDLNDLLGALKLHCGI